MHIITSLKDVEKAAKIVDTALCEDFPYKKETIQAYQKDIFNEKYTNENIIIGAFKENELVGLIALKPDFGGVVFIDWLVVEKSHRGKGLGLLLLEETEKWALENKFHYLYLCTETEKNKEFYTKRGFRYVGTHYKSWFGENEHIFEKILKEKPFNEVFK